MLDPVYFQLSFLLESVGKGDKIVPKGILLITGSKKSRADFVLALEYEIGLIDVYNAKDELNSVCDKIYQIEEEIKRTASGKFVYTLCQV